MPTLSRFFRAFAIFALFCGTALPSFAQDKPSLDTALDNIPVEKIIGKLMGAIDINAVIDIATQGADKAAADVAAGRAPELGSLENSTAVKEMQAKMQKQMSAVAPELIRSFTPLIGLMLGEFKKEFAESFNAQ
ncbi:MAG: hypothetical protein EAZ37_01530 [Burkholderiales bacterium]|nr:MAG: hypothetical protein EAZ37_01530 [Burkholderiales bacterium]